MKMLLALATVSLVSVGQSAFADELTYRCDSAAILAVQEVADQRYRLDGFWTRACEVEATGHVSCIVTATKRDYKDIFQVILDPSCTQALKVTMIGENR